MTVVGAGGKQQTNARDERQSPRGRKGEVNKRKILRERDGPAVTRHGEKWEFALQWKGQSATIKSTVCAENCGCCGRNRPQIKRDAGRGRQTGNFGAEAFRRGLEGFF